MRSSLKTVGLLTFLVALAISLTGCPHGGSRDPVNSVNISGNYTCTYNFTTTTTTVSGTAPNQTYTTTVAEHTTSLYLSVTQAEGDDSSDTVTGSFILAGNTYIASESGTVTGTMSNNICTLTMTSSTGMVYTCTVTIVDGRLYGQGTWSDGTAGDFSSAASTTTN